MGLVDSSFEDLASDIKTLKIANYLFFALTWLPWSTPIFMVVFWCCFARHEKLQDMIDIFRERGGAVYLDGPRVVDDVIREPRDIFPR